MKPLVGFLFGFIILVFVALFVVIPRIGSLSPEQKQGWNDWFYPTEACKRNSPFQRNDIVMLRNGTKFVMVDPCYDRKKSFVLDVNGKDTYIPSDLLTKVEN